MSTFKKEVTTYGSEPQLTPYQAAQREWDNRIGSSIVQAKNWRIMAFLSIGMVLLLLALVFFLFTSKKDRLFVAEVASTGQIINVVPLQVEYNPTIAQKEYFITQFIENIRSLPLDPVIAKQNWLKAYAFLSSRANNKLNELLRQQNPLKSLGVKTITVDISDINPISGSTFQINWIETVVNISGFEEVKNKYSGVFTVAVEPPSTQQQILRNPLGLFIVDFNISTRS